MHNIKTAKGTYSFRRKPGRSFTVLSKGGKRLQCLVGQRMNVGLATKCSEPRLRYYI